MKAAPNVRKNMKLIVFVFVAMFAALIVYLFFAVSNFGDRWFGMPYNPRLSQAKSSVAAGSIYDRNGYTLAQTEDGERTYAANKYVRIATSHIVGDQIGLTRGAEVFFARQLYGFDDTAADRIKQAMSGLSRKGNDITLSIDAELSNRIWETIEGRNAAAVVIDYTTGEILASVSTPGFNQKKIDDYTQDEDGTELFNRATMGKYPPGSAFKIITAAAVIDNPAYDIGEIECTGSVNVGGYTLSCAGGTAHGKVDLETAFAKSCNVYFAQAAVRLGSALEREAERFCFNDEFLFDDLILYSSTFAGGDTAAVAMAGIGQGDDLVTPMHMAMIAGAVANGGKMMTPKLLLSEQSAEGKPMYKFSPEVYTQAVSKSTADALVGLMVSAVESGTGSRAAIDGLSVGGKTGTAQYTDGDGDISEHAWFAGFIDDPAHPLAVAVIIEDAGSGGKNAAPVAGAALAAAVKLGY